MAWLKVISAGVLGVGIILIKLFLRSRRYNRHVLLLGKTVIVTGANCGIGREAAFEFADREARVILACRNIEKANEAAKIIRQKTKKGSLVIKKLDLASFESIRAFSEEILREEERIDILVNNAGVFQTPLTKTEDDLELQMGVNHMGHFLLTNLLLDKLKQSSPSRVVIVSSSLAKYGKIDFENINSEKSYNRKSGYNNSKLANLYFGRELASRTKDAGVDIFCIHPGIVSTNLGRHIQIPLLLKLFYPIFWMLIRGPAQGCQPVIHCATAPELKGQSGTYFGKTCKAEPWPASCSDETVQKKLWDVSVQMTKL